MEILNDRVLVLNKSFYPLSIVTVRRALELLFSDKAVITDSQWISYTLDEWSSDNLGDLTRAIRTTSKLYIAPETIRLKAQDKVFERGINLTRQNVFIRDNFSCMYCSSTQDLTIDHVVPRSRAKDFGFHPKRIHSWGNLVTCCYKCNSKKANRTPEEVGFVLREKPRRPAGITFKMKRGWKPCWDIFFAKGSND